MDGPMEAGRHKVTWHGTNSAGQSVASGIYFIQMQSKDITATRKAVLVK